MKLLSYNISIKDNNTLDVIDFIRDNNIEIAMLTESMRHLEDSVFPTYKSAIPIANAFKSIMPYEFFAPLYVADAIKGDINIDFGGKLEEGHQMLSKYPIVEADNQFYYNHFKYGFDSRDFRKKDWVRALQRAVIDINGTLVQIFNVHGIWHQGRMGNENTRKQCEYIIKTALAHDMPTIIAGDFNLLPESPDIEMFSPHFRNLIKEFDIKSTRPNFDDGLDEGDMVVDYIFVNKDIKVKDFAVKKSDVSDHYPLVVDFNT